MMQFDKPQPELAPWWHPHTLRAGETWHYVVGPLSFYVQRNDQEWDIAWERDKEQDELAHCAHAAISQLPEHLTNTRYVFSQMQTAFALKPELLDRPLVVKTRQPVRLAPAQEATFYISSPVTVGLYLTDPELCLERVPSLQLSDTWFGPNTRDGELCFAARTHARNRRDELPLRPHRAVTPVTIKNQSMEFMTIDKLSIPLPYLNLYGGDDGSLWTNAIELKHTADNALAALEPGPAPRGLELITPAREAMQRSGLVRAFTSFFSD